MHGPSYSPWVWVTVLYWIRASFRAFLCTLRRTKICLWSLLFVVVGFFGPCTWEPGRGVPGCRGGLRPFVVLLFLFGSKILPLEWSCPSFHFFTCTMGFAPIKWTCTAFFWPRQLTDRAILARRQTQEKKVESSAEALQGKRARQNSFRL